jgi:protein involved in polysaccharide export with SLBB domain
MLRACLSVVCGLGGLAALSGCMGDPLPKQSLDFPQASFPSWSGSDAGYRFYPGDRFRIDLQTAPELSAELTIGPDGRVSPPSLGAVMAADLTVRELQTLLEQMYARELIDPSLSLTPIDFGSQKIFVGGEVRQPGVFDLPGEIDPLQAVILAGGWTDEGRATKVIVMRRAPGGELQTRVVDVRNGLAKQSLYDIGPLQRFDVVYVTRKAIADENLFVQQYIRNALPIDFSFYYDVNRF